MAHENLIGALCVGITLIATSAQADDRRPYASAMLQYVMFDDARPLENDLGMQLGLGLPITERIALEFNYLGRSVDGRPSGTLEQSGFGLDALWFFNGRDGAFDPYFLLGYGQLNDDYGSGNDDYSSTQFALGFTDDIDEYLAFRAELRVYKNEDFAGSTDLALGIGLLYRFGEAERQTAAVASAPAPVPAPAPAPAPIAEPVPVAAVVAAPVVAEVVDGDADADGVKDSADRCPGTPAGAAVLADGCPVPKVVKLEGVNFTMGTATFVAGAQAKLDEAIAKLKENPEVAVEVAGHTDVSGDAAVNRALSQERADAVRQYLLAGGIAAERVSARGYGEDEPAASNDTAEGRAANRRVELRVRQ